MANVQAAGSRVLDKIYIFYFLLLIPIALGIDLQDYYPVEWVPGALKFVREDWIRKSGDPFLRKGALGGEVQEAWFWSFTLLEAFFQVPVFFIAIYGLLIGTPKIYALTLAYGASTASTVIPCLATVFAIPTVTAATTSTLALTAQQKWIILGSYGPFFVFPLIMAVDSAVQLCARVGGGAGGRRKGAKEL
ncbi:hypothetical protein FRB99_004289 [Tulasnella sp. 403]|nr:hypothetical protein FRB99_004289 [Tulasnella sp. 403]